ncbi:hypothetical protein MTO96_015956 [Rhipicephalus appendiculatus]
MSQMAAVRKIPLIIRGGQGGKTCAVIIFSKELFSVTGIAVYYAGNINGNQEDLTARDTAGKEDYKLLRPLSYTDDISMCFSIDSPDSLGDKQKLRRPAVRHFCPSVPIILATKKNLRSYRLTLPHAAIAKQKNAAPEEERTMAKDTDGHGLPGVLRQDKGWCARDSRRCDEFGIADQVAVDDDMYFAM